jgi:hypothetical protein
MRTSLNEIRQIEQYLEGKNEQGESSLLQSRLLNEPTLWQQVRLQRVVMRLVKLFHFKKMKTEVQQTGIKIFNDPGRKDFQQSIHQLFNQ